MNGRTKPGLMVLAAVMLFTLSAISQTAPGAFAFSFEPMSITFDPSGPGSIRTFRLENDGKDRIAIRVSIMTRVTAEDGTETNEAAADSFLVFPSRFVIEAGGTRALKVQWKGGDPGVRERAFRIIAEQVPVEMNERQGSGISLLFRYVGALYVRPASAQPANVHLVSATGSEQDGKTGILIRLANDGGLHALLTDVRVLVAPSIEFTSPPGIEGQNMLAGSRRIFFVPTDEATAGREYDARIEFKNEY